MPITYDNTTHKHQVLINQSIIKQIDDKVDNMKKDVDEIKEAIKFIKEYTENKKEREDAKWFY